MARVAVDRKAPRQDCQMFGRVRNYLCRLFLPHLYTPEGFRRTERLYALPDEPIPVPAGQKRTMTVCNLFANQHKNIDEIAKLLDTSRRLVIAQLILEGLIVDRRQMNREPRLERRQTIKYHLPITFPTGHSDDLRALCGQFGAETVTDFIFNQVLRREERCAECDIRSRRSTIVDEGC